MKKQILTGRERYVDIVKGWAIILIVINHISASFSGFPVFKFFGINWHCAILYFIAGFFIVDEKFKSPRNFLYGKFRSLYIPVTIIYLIAILLHNVFVSWDWYPVGMFHPSNHTAYAFLNLKETIIGIVKVLLCGGSGEHVMGAMWFVYVLMYAFVIMTFIRWGISKLIRSSKIEYLCMGTILVLFTFISWLLSHEYGITVNRFSTTLSVMSLIYMGFITNRVLKCKFDNIYLFVILAFISISCTLSEGGNKSRSK